MLRQDWVHTHSVVAPTQTAAQLYAIPWDVLAACVPQPYGDGLQQGDRLNRA